MWQRAAADLDPPGVPNSFRHAKNQQNIAGVLLRREFGGARRQKPARALGEDKEENFWAESESASKVRALRSGAVSGRVGAEQRVCVRMCLCATDSTRAATLSCRRPPSRLSRSPSVPTGEQDRVRKSGAIAERLILATCRKTFASTHGDHTVKIICIETGRVIQVRAKKDGRLWGVVH